jgi:hypothetical protein
MALLRERTHPGGVAESHRYSFVDALCLGCDVTHFDKPSINTKQQTNTNQKTNTKQISNKKFQGT